MRFYIFFNKKRTPKSTKAMKYIYNQSFDKEFFSGGVYNRRKNELPYCIMFRWPKWVANKDIPDYSHTVSIEVYFSPFEKGLRVSKNALQLADKKKYKYTCMIQVYNAFGKKNELSVIDISLLTKAIFFYAKELDGIIYIPVLNKIITPEIFHNKNKKLIELQFNKKINKSLLTLNSVKERINL
jgi:hypothetical protein